MMASPRSVDRNLKFGLVQSAIRRPSLPYVILVEGALAPPLGRTPRRPPECHTLRLPHASEARHGAEHEQT